MPSEKQAEPVWGDREDDLTDAIRANHPFRTKRFDIYERAQELVINRHSKAALIELVSYLLVQAEPAPAQCKHPVWGQDKDGTRVCAKCGLVEHPAARSGAVKVKPLEWVRGWMNAEAQTDIGLYQIAYRRDGSFEWCFGIKKEWASSWDAAKEAAQSDYERRILSALEPAEPATDAEREFNEVLKGAQEFNDALPERMRRNARDWLRPDDEPATDAEPYTYFYRYSDPISGKPVWRSSGGLWNGQHPSETLPLFTRPPESRLREALEGLLAPFSDDPCRLDHHGYCQAHFLELHCCVAKARAALAQEDGR